MPIRDGEEKRAIGRGGERVGRSKNFVIECAAANFLKLALRTVRLIAREVDHPAGRQVIGGYKAGINSDWYPTDCYGAPKVCTDGEPPLEYE